MEKIEHFSHIHPLFLKEEEENDNNGNKQILCSGCGTPISGPAFCCDQCNYILHKSCTELPRYMKHPFHPQHPLTLLSTSPYKGHYICDACRGIYKNFVYHCCLCHYDLDITCACRWHPGDGHRHDFMLSTNMQPFICYACGEEANESLAFLCTICQILVHSCCAQMPFAIRINGHPHRLKLSYNLHEVYGFRVNMTCGACYGTMSSAFAGYFCSECMFPVHLRCPRPYLREEWETATESDEDEECEEEESYLGSENEDSQDIVGFSFFSHEHSLKFMEDQQSTLQYGDKVCDGCAQPITTPFFSCEKEENCGFLLHQSCAELPRTKQHPFHVHPLTLFSKAPPYDGIYRCDGCRLLSNGFVYRCEECQFDLDVCCGSLQERVEHEGHKHPLFLKKTSIARQCKGCHVWSKHMFVCDVCEDFAIDCGCATLPCKVWHVYDKHPLILNYFVEGDLREREYECGICNEKMAPKQWFYYCVDCDLAAHPYCVIGKSWRIKFGGSFQYDAHSHPLALVEEAMQNTKCEACGKGCDGWTLKCGQCKCYFHREGNCFWEQFKKSAKYLALSGTMRHRYAANVLAATPNVRA
ncbi:hypothetical protein RJT34_20248 [Clitoria ternatea]|uniref:Phorbol-ester/DAG-type domain-containing protein n=1 Tax=Clitoria ternatea TaxID=43366 RepID=A0AAN9ISI7_CLITE